MSWSVAGNMYEICSCNAMCPCWLGPNERPDQGWCGGALVIDISQGKADGVDLSGCKAAVTVEWPGNFFGGNGTARVYVDAAASEAQRRELEAIMGGKKGGLFEGLWGAVVTKWQPAKSARIDVQRDDPISISVGDIGKATLALFKDQAGGTAKVQGTAAQGAFQSASMELASARGTRWSDPDFRKWEGNSATVHNVQWSA